MFSTLRALIRDMVWHAQTAGSCKLCNRLHSRKDVPNVGVLCPDRVLLLQSSNRVAVCITCSVLGGSVSCDFSLIRGVDMAVCAL